MPRRYLLTDEVAAALRRGKAVECFVGPCDNSSGLGIRWISLRVKHGEVCASVFESRDEGSSNFVDIYEFGPLNAEREHGEPEERIMFSDLSECLAAIAKKWPEVSSRLVNEGVVQDEYKDFIAHGRRHA